MRVAVEKLPGVTGAEVSLEDGLVTVGLEPENTLTLAALRDAIRERGFSPREAEVRVAGQVEMAEGAPALHVPGSARLYRLVAAAEALERLRAAQGRTVVLAGNVPRSEDGEDPATIHVIAVEDP